MNDQQLWDNFKKTGRIADYLRYRGVDIYAFQNTVDRKEPSDANCQARPSSHHRGPDHT